MEATALGDKVVLHVAETSGKLFNTLILGFILDVSLLWSRNKSLAQSRGRTLVMLQSEVSDFVVSPWELLPFLRSGSGSRAGGR